MSLFWLWIDGVRFRVAAWITTASSRGLEEFRGRRWLDVSIPGLRWDFWVFFGFYWDALLYF